MKTINIEIKIAEVDDGYRIDLSDWAENYFPKDNPVTFRDVIDRLESIVDYVKRKDPFKTEIL